MREGAECSPIVHGRLPAALLKGRQTALAGGAVDKDTSAICRPTTNRGPSAQCYVLCSCVLHATCTAASTSKLLVLMSPNWTCVDMWASVVR